jgi:hypothetical protein
MSNELPSEFGYKTATRIMAIVLSFFVKEWYTPTRDHASFDGKPQASARAGIADACGLPLTAR